MFSDKYDLTQAVLEGRKTQTRRVITYPKAFHGKDVCGYYVCRRATDRAITEVCMYDENESFIDEGQILPKYKVGEVVAVAQKYKDVGIEDVTDKDGFLYHTFTIAGYDNKMFVRPDLMPHQIRITDVRVERLQDISDEDCIKEGVELNTRQYEYDGTRYYCVRGLGYWRGFGCTNFHTPREAFAALIDKVSGKGTWERNPYVFVYDFELVK